MVEGVLIGKFMPPHEGHVFLLDFARSYVNRLTVFVSSVADDPISCEQRLKWLKELLADCEIVVVKQAVRASNRQEWLSAIRWSCPKVDYLFAEERLGLTLADELSAHLVTLDPPMVSLELESRAIRANPDAYWHRLPLTVRPSYLKKVCVFGPESTGKSTLCAMLAEHFQTLAVPEYSRTYLEHKGARYELADVVPVARGQRALEFAYTRRARRLVFCDTDMLTTKIWSDWLFGRSDPWLLQAVKQEKHDLYLLTAADVPWVEDPVRYLPEPEDRVNFARTCEVELGRYERKFVKLSGDWEARFEKAVRAVDKLLLL